MQALVLLGILVAASAAPGDAKVTNKPLTKTTAKAVARQEIQPKTNPEADSAEKAEAEEDLEAEAEAKHYHAYGLIPFHGYTYHGENYGHYHKKRSAKPGPWRWGGHGSWVRRSVNNKIYDMNKRSAES